MARKYYDENGNVVKKRGGCLKWIGIGVLVIIVIGVLGTVFGGWDESADTATEASSSEVSATEESTSEETPEAKTDLLAVGDSATIDDITVTVNNVSFTDERNEFADTTPERVIAIEYTLENGQEEDYPFGMDMQLYVDGKKADTYPLGTDMGSVSAGRTVDSITYFGVDGENIELEWQPMFSLSDKAIWDLTE